MHGRTRATRRASSLIAWLTSSCVACTATGTTEPSLPLAARPVVAIAVSPKTPPSAVDPAPALASATALPDAVSAPAEGPVEHVALPEIDALLERALAERKLPGAVVAVGRRDGLLFLKAYGNRALEPAVEPMTVDTIFDLASLTKPVATAAAIMLLIEQGKLSLETKAADVLLELRAHRKGDIRVRDLLVHGAGLPQVDSIASYANGKQTAFDRMFALPVKPRSARTFVYSDVGYLWLGEIVERVSGVSLAEFCAQHLFAKLGMRDTRFTPAAELRARIAPTERLDPRRLPLLSEQERAYGVVRGAAHDPRAFRLGGVAGNAGLFSTGHDLARYARMLLNHGVLDAQRVLSRESVELMTAPQALGKSVRALGWDMRSVYSGLRGKRLSQRAFGHGGFTGTSLWLDPDQDLFVILLSNRVHPDGKGYVITLAGEIADAAASALGRASRPASCTPFVGHVQPGIDTLRAQNFAALAGKRIGLLAHRASVARDGASSIELLRHAKNVTLGAIFAPEHGLTSEREGRISDAQSDGVPVYSLFGKTRKPTPSMLQDLDAIVFDLQDVGTRFYTYFSTLRLILQAAAEAGIEVVVLDRPNPLGGVRIEGPVLAPAIRTFVNYHALPVRHGLTAGEMAGMLNAELRLGAKLTVVRMTGYRRELSWEDTGLRWIAPSPNLADATATQLYPALGLLESSNLSVGRGTERPFRFVGAPWLDAPKLLARLQAAALPGVSWALAERTPQRDRYKGERCLGLDVTVTDARALRPVRTALTLAVAVTALHADRFALDDFGRLLGHPRALAGLRAGASVAELETLVEPELHTFEARRAPHLLYPPCDVAEDAR